MKTKNLLSIVLCTSLFSVCAFGKDVYVYNTGEKEPVQTLKKTRKISFESDRMDVWDTENNLTSVNFSDFSFLTFQPKEIKDPSSLPSVSENQPVICIDALGALKIQSQEAITKVELYTVQGVKVQEYAPMQMSFSTSVSDKPSGVYVLRVSLGEKIITSKFVKK